MLLTEGVLRRRLGCEPNLSIGRIAWHGSYLQYHLQRAPGTIVFNTEQWKGKCTLSLCSWEVQQCGSLEDRTKWDQSASCSSIVGFCSGDWHLDCVAVEWRITAGQIVKVGLWVWRRNHPYELPVNNSFSIVVKKLKKTAYCTEDLSAILHTLSTSSKLTIWKDAGNESSAWALHIIS